jgi:hypothetical protein
MRATTLLVFVLLSWPSLVEAQADVSPQLALARICASEAGLRVTDDCAAIYAVLTRGARSPERFMARARAYSGRVFDTSRVDSRAWIAHLNPEGARPHGWPTERTARTARDEGGRIRVRYVAPPSWDRYRASWLELYAHAGRILAGRISHRCETQPEDWGGDMDTARYTRAYPNARQINCGDTRNNFWLQNAPAPTPSAEEPTEAEE